MHTKTCFVLGQRALDAFAQPGVDVAVKTQVLDILLPQKQLYKKAAKLVRSVLTAYETEIQVRGCFFSRRHVGLRFRWANFHPCLVDSAGYRYLVARQWIQ